MRTLSVAALSLGVAISCVTLVQLIRDRDRVRARLAAIGRNEL